MKKIGILVPSLQGNGACKVPAIHSIMFYDDGFDVEIITEYGEPIFPYKGKLTQLNIKKRKGILKFLSLFQLIIKLRKIKAKNKYDFFISHTPHCDIANALTKGSETVITTVHNNIEKCYSKFIKLLFPIVIKKSDLVIVVSKKIETILHKQYGNKDKIICIYNPIDFSLVSKLSTDNLPSHLNNKKFILNVGRLDTQKGQWHLIKAFSLLVDKYPDLYLVIIGEGNKKDELIQLSNKLEISDKIYFEGFQDNPYSYMKNASAFILPSLFEGLPLVLIEAMYCKTPIIATDCISGPKELLVHHGVKSGYLIPDNAKLEQLTTTDINSFDHLIADKIIEIFNDKDETDRIINNAFLRTIDFSLNEILTSWKKVFSYYEKINKK